MKAVGMEAKKLRYKVLFLASWYPNRINPLLGVFVRRKAEAVRRWCDVAVLSVAEDPALSVPYDVNLSVIDSIPTAVVYFKTSPHPLLRGLLYNLRYFRAYTLGWGALKRSWGSPDFLHVNVIDRAGYFALLLRWIRKFEYVVTEHSTPDIDFLKGERPTTAVPLRFMKDRVIRNSSAVNVDSHASLQYLIKAGFRGNFCVIPNVVEINDEIFRTKKRKKKKTIGLHISNLIPRKNVEGIIDACGAIVRSGRNDFEIHIIGDGPNRSALENRARDLGVLESCVKFLGTVSEPEKQTALYQADFHVLNSDEEGFSVVTAEAICYGTPVIATACGGPEDFVTPETGLLIARRDPAALRKAIEQMLDHAQDFSAAVLREYGRKHFSAERVAEMTHEMYSRSVSRWTAGNTAFPVTIPPKSRVLDVGSGHQPNHRANVLLERYLEPTIHRTNQHVPIPADKTMIVGDALSMPFRDRAFDFVIASHIAEHVDDPVKFCGELQRVARSGYFETPGPLTEFLMPTASHKWIVYKKGNDLIFKENPYRVSAWRGFFRFFYLNREGYLPDTWRSDNPLLILSNFLLLKLWSVVPYAYTKIRWDQRVATRVLQR